MDFDLFMKRLSTLCLLGGLLSVAAAEPTGLEMGSPMSLAWKVEVGPYAARNGVDSGALMKTMDGILTEAGFRTVPPPHEAELKLFVESDGNGDFLSLELSLSRPVEFKVGAEAKTINAATWRRTFNGRINKQPSVASVLVSELMGQFVDAHKTSNTVTMIEGKVVAADPKYQFVVVDLGKGRDIQPNMKLGVWREGKRLGALGVVRVADDYSVANPLGSLKTEMIIEGDKVKIEP